MASHGSSDARCRLTGDRLFPAASPCEVVEDGLLYCVRGSLDAGLRTLADNPASSLTPHGMLPLGVVDVVRWAGLRQVALDRPAFIKHWRRYLAGVAKSLQRAGAADSASADALVARGHLFARTLIQRFDECDFLLTSSEDPRGAYVAAPTVPTDATRRRTHQRWLPPAPHRLVILLYEDQAPLSPLLFFLKDGCVTPAGGVEPPCASRAVDSDSAVPDGNAVFDRCSHAAGAVSHVQCR
jgi:hypothetical protein